MSGGEQSPLFFEAKADDLRPRKLLPLVAINTDSCETPLHPHDFNMDGIDIYTNTLCYGPGGRHDLCSYCFLSTSQLKSRNMMSLEDVDDILGWATREDSPITTVSLLGGEFALHPKSRDIAAKVYDAGLNTHIVTNGSPAFWYMMDDFGMISRLRDRERDNLVAVSLDSLTPEVNDKYRGRRAHNNAMLTIDMLRRQNIRFRVNATVMQGAVEGLEDLFDFAQEKGAEEVLVHFPSSAGRGRRFPVGTEGNDELYRRRIARNETFLNAEDWQFYVSHTASLYNKDNITRQGFRVKCEQGFDLTFTCHLQERSSSLQFLPPSNAANGAMPVVSCGLNMDRADTTSAYLFRDGELYTRPGVSELSVARVAGHGGGKRGFYECPLMQGTGRACIYERIGDE